MENGKLARTQGFFFMRKPGTALAIAFVVATTASSIFAHLWPFVGMEGLPGEYILFTWNGKKIRMDAWEPDSE